jgi:WD40 repeat protein/tRNA A-37 threonylcarbamoyl transferase component Bud32
MTYCLNPTCKAPQNSDDAQICRFCGSRLKLRDRYSVIRLIGQGGFGRTFLAVDEKGKENELQRRLSEKDVLRTDAEKYTKQNLCVVKQFFPRDINPTQQEKAIALFYQEAERLRELGTHSQIPDLIDFFEEQQQFYLVQEFIVGQNLEDALEQQGVFSEEAIWQLLAEILPVLKFIHDRSVIHRDIKPANLIWRSPSPPLTPSTPGNLVLVDFGAAKRINLAERQKTGTTIGSAEYVAPEQLRGKAVFASDLYSLGVTCIHLLTGMSPFDLFDSINDTWVWRDYLETPVSDRLAQLLNQLLPNALNKRLQSATQALQFLSSPPSPSPPSFPPSPSLLHTLIGHTSCINSIAISSDRQTLASGSDDKTVRVWNVVTGECLMTLTEQHQPIRTVAFSPNDALLAVAADDKAIALWDWRNQRITRTLNGHTQMIRAIAFHPTEPVLASASWDKTIRLWNYQTGDALTTLIGHKLQATAVAISPNGEWLASASVDRTVRLWQLRNVNETWTGFLRYVLEGHVSAVFAVAFSPDSQLLATGGDDRTIKLWDVATGRLVRTLEGHSWAIAILAFTPGYETLISGSWDTTVKLWYLQPHRKPESVMFVGQSDAAQAIAFSPDGMLMASGSRDKTIKIYGQYEPLP